MFYHGLIFQVVLILTTAEAGTYDLINLTSKKITVEAIKLIFQTFHEH